MMAHQFSPNQRVAIPVCSVPPCPWWGQAVIVVSCDFRRVMVLHFGFRGGSVMGDSRPSLSIL